MFKKIKFPKLNQSGVAHLLYPILGLAVVAVIAGAGFYVYQQNNSGAGAKKKNITLKVVIRNLPGCRGLSGSVQYDFRKAGEYGYSGDSLNAKPSKTVCGRVKNGSQTYYRATMTFKFNNVPVYSKSKVKWPNPANRYTLYYTLPSNGVTMYRLKFQNFNIPSSYGIIEDSSYTGTTGEVRSPDFEKLSSRAINLEVY